MTGSPVSTALPVAVLASPCQREGNNPYKVTLAVVFPLHPPFYLPITVAEQFVQYIYYIIRKRTDEIFHLKPLTALVCIDLYSI